MSSQSQISAFLSIVLTLFFLPALVCAGEAGPDGSFSHTYPITLPPGTGGMQPDLALVYNSNTGNGFCGVGWGLKGLPSIFRDSSYPVKFNGNDHYIFSGQWTIPRKTMTASKPWEEKSTLSGEQKSGNFR